jgi:hypothetical protein
MGLIVNISIIIVLILITIIVGIVHSRIGKPYPGIYLAIHKLATIAFVIFMAVLVVQFFKVNEPSNLLVTSIIIACLSMVGLLISGIFLSLEKWEDLMPSMHKVSTLLFLIGASGIFYILLK